MKVRICSDLHLENHTYKIPTAVNDYTTDKVIPKMDSDSESVLVIAGDICNISYLNYHYRFFDEISKRFKAIVVVPGNHEYWHGNGLSDQDKIYKDFLKDFDNIHLLQDSWIKIDDVVFCGGTLWTDLHNPMDAFVALKGMLDYYKTNYYGSRLAPSHTNSAHLATKMFLYGISKHMKEVGEKYVVVTHHGPSFKSASPRFANSPLNCAFYSNMDEFIETCGSPLWIHGHTHDSHDYYIGDTRIVCNPMGYNLGAENPGFDPKLVIEV